MQDKELFEDYEIKNWELSPRIYKIVGATAVLHVLAIFTFGQFNLLQTKACDAAYVGKVCQVLDAVYVASLFGGNKEWVSEDYKKDEIGDADITYIDVSGDEPPFEYPEGYFAVANPEDQMMNNNGMLDFGMPTGDPNQPPAQLDLNAPQVLPTPNDSVANQPIPDKPFDFGDSAPPVRQPPVARTKTPRLPRQPRIRNDSPNALPKLGNSETANANTNTATPNANTSANTEAPKNNANTNTSGAVVQPKSDQEILAFQPNKKPLEDFRDLVKEKVEKKEVNLQAPFSITVDGALTKEGKLDPKKTRFINPSGDPKMIDVAKAGIEALNNSGVFTYLDKLGDKRIVMTLTQDQNGITAVVQSQVETEEKAKSIASGFNTLISVGKMLRKGNDEAVLMESAKVTNQGKVFVMNFALPQAVAQDMIRRSLTETEKKTEPSGLAGSKNTNAQAK